MMRPTWENTFNAELRRDWSNIGYPLQAASEAGYHYLLWDGR